MDLISQQILRVLGNMFPTVIFEIAELNRGTTPFNPFYFFFIYFFSPVSLFMNPLYQFVLGVAFPSFLILKSTKLALFRKVKSFPILRLFLICLCTIWFLGLVFWAAFVADHIYYEWDTLVVPFTYLWHQTPLIDWTSSWLAKGWTLQMLTILWVVECIICYGIAGAISLWTQRKNSSYRQYRKFILINCSLLMLLSIFVALFPMIGMWPFYLANKAVP